MDVLNLFEKILTLVKRIWERGVGWHNVIILMVNR